ncbi:MAG: hypothetical protein ACJ790_10570 [Myxococcaceae bacterium]
MGAVFLFAGSASAKVKVAVEKFTGPSASKAEAAVKSALSKREEVEVVSMKGHPQVLVSGQTSKLPKKMVKLEVSVNTADGERVGGSTWKIKNGQTKPLELSLWATVGKHMKKAAASGGSDSDEEAPAVASKKPGKVIDVPKADEEEARPVVASKKKERATEESAENESKRSEDSEDVHGSDSENGVSTVVRGASEGGSEYGELDADVGVHAFTRSFTYNQPLQGSLASYKLSSGPSVGVNALWFAGKLADDESPLKNLGAAVAAETAFGIGSAAQDGSRVGTSAYQFDVGARYRIPLDQHRVVLGAGYGQRAFSVADTQDAVLSMVPDVSYKFVSIRAAGRYVINEQLSLNATVAYLHLLGTGELGSAKFFPRLSGAGVEASVFVGYEILPKWEVRVGADLQRFFFALHPEPGDQNVAGGAVDQFFAGTARVAYKFD